MLAFTGTFATAGSYLLVGATSNSTSSGNASIYVRQIAITESLPGAFALTPSTLTVPCNTSVSQTFTANTVTAIPSGTLTYTWTIGSGWSYLGTPGPTTVTTPTNSITLVSSGSSTAPANVSVGVNFNGRNESNLTCAVSLVPLSSLTISGGNSMCTTGASNVYTIPNLPTGATIAWAATPTGIVTLSSTSGASTTLTRSGAVGKVSLTATVTACGSVAGLTLPITVGVLDNTKLTVVGEGPGICPNVPIMFGARYNGSCANFNAAGISDITWNVSPTPTQIVYNDGTAGCTGSVNNAGVTIKFPASPTQYNVKITATNACGTTSFSTPYVVQIMSSGCGSHLVTVSPNAASSTVTVATISKTADATFDEVKIYNLQGTLKKQFQYKKVNSATLNVADLSNGIYFIEVTSGKVKDKLQLIIQK